MKPRSAASLRWVPVVLLLACAGKPVAEKPRPAAGAPVLRLLTYNVNYAIPGDGAGLDAIADAQADLVLLQETNPAWEYYLRARFASRYPHRFFVQRGGSGGMGILARMPIVEHEVIPPTERGWFPSIRFVVQTAWGPVQGLNVHLRPPASDSGSYVSGYFVKPDAHAEEIAACFDKLSDRPTFIAGDFNEEPGGDATRFLLARGMVSALGRFAPGIPTWRWSIGVGTLRRQLDQVFYSRHLDVLSAEVREAGRSDHLPVIAVLTPARGPRTK
jgi:endonuclease/exonuclease/phosphatase (EEP) superfamily protein YafD